MMLWSINYKYFEKVCQTELWIGGYQVWYTISQFGYFLKQYVWRTMRPSIIFNLNPSLIFFPLFFSSNHWIVCEIHFSILVKFIWLIDTSLKKVQSKLQVSLSLALSARGFKMLKNWGISLKCDVGYNSRLIKLKFVLNVKVCVRKV